MATIRVQLPAQFIARRGLLPNSFILVNSEEEAAEVLDLAHAYSAHTQWKLTRITSASGTTELYFHDRADAMATFNRMVNYTMREAQVGVVAHWNNAKGAFFSAEGTGRKKNYRYSVRVEQD